MSEPNSIHMGDFSHGEEWGEKLKAKGWWHSFELPDGTTIDGVCTLDSLKLRFSQFPIPDDLQGKRVLDIGAWDGWFSFESERRGAEVVAIDCWDNPRFREMKKRLNSRVEYRILDMFDLTPERIGHFDIVIFMGVLYHLKHPLLALERVCALSTELVAVDSFILQESNDPAGGAFPVVRYFENLEFSGNPDNWVAPNLPALLAMCRIAGFARVELRGVQQWGAAVACHRRWPEAVSGTPAPALEKVVHALNSGINFRNDADEYAAAWILTPEPDLSLDDVQPAVGPFGSRPISVNLVGDQRWQINFKVPPQILGGWQDVTVRVKAGSPSNAVPIALDMAPQTPGIEVLGVVDSVTGRIGEFDPRQGPCLSLWVRGLPSNADPNNLRVWCDDALLDTLYVGPQPESAQHSQVNARFRESPAAGSRAITVRLRDAWGATVASADAEVLVNAAQ